MEAIYKEGGIPEVRWLPIELYDNVWNSFEMSRENLKRVLQWCMRTHDLKNPQHTPWGQKMVKFQEWVLDDWRNTFGRHLDPLGHGGLFADQLRKLVDHEFSVDLENS